MMKGSWGDKFAVPLARGTRSLRFAGLCKRGGRFPVSRHGCFPALLASGCSHTQRTWPAGPPSNHRLWTQCRKSTQDPLPAECQRQGCFQTLPPHPSPCPHSLLKSLPFHDRLDTHFGPSHELADWGLSPAWASLSCFLPVPATGPQGHGMRAASALKVTLCVSPRPATRPWNDTQLLGRPLLPLTQQMGAESWLEWNRRKT